MSGACSTYGGGEKCTDGFGQEIRSKKGNLEKLGVEGRIMLKRTLNK
jgi:hypothetical protein